MVPLTIAITGANAGIGLRAARKFAADGHRVVALARDAGRSKPVLDAISESAKHPVLFVQADLSEPESIRAAATTMTGELGSLDAVIHNAAVFDQTQRAAAYTSTGHELFWATNHLGPFELTARLSPLLAASARPRVVFVASKGLITMPRIAIRFDELDSPAWYSPTKAYYHSKLAQIMTATTLAERVGDKLGVVTLRVPAVRLDPDRLAAMPVILRALYAPKNKLAASPESIGEVYAELATGGHRGYVDENLNQVAVPKFATDASARAKLWELSQAAAGNPEWAWELAPLGR